MKKMMQTISLLAALAVLPAADLAHAQFVRLAPPPPVSEPRVPPPDRRYVWVPGYQRWNGRAYAWTPGRYVLPPRPRAYWMPGRWEARSGGWIWIPGRWKD